MEKDSTERREKERGKADERKNEKQIMSEKGRVTK